MKLISNDCANCRRVIGYVTPGALLIPTLCIICVNEPGTLKEWGHKIDKNEKPVREVAGDLRDSLNRLQLC